MARNIVCSECGGSMENGFIVETANAIRPYDASYWLEGKPEKSYWLGLKTENKKAFYITAYRCESCGLLKFYAGPDNSRRSK